MNPLIESGVLEELEYGSNFGYVLRDNASFLSMEYKVLQSQTNSVFIPCMKMLYNGKIQLYYMTAPCTPLSAMLSDIAPDCFLTIVKNLLSGIMEVKKNGFLSCRKIDIAFEHIYVERNTFRVSLVYLPLNSSAYPDDASFENALRIGLVRVISAIPTLSSPRIYQLGADLQNGMLSLEDLAARFGCTIPEKSGTRVKPEKPIQKKTAGMRLVALNAPSRLELRINKPEFTIGKKETNDGIVRFNAMISRVHCKISCSNGQYFISDQLSANGTFLNGVRLQPKVPTSLKNGDVVRLANSDFQVVIE